MIRQAAFSTLHTCFDSHHQKLINIIDRLCSLVVKVPGYTTEKYCASCEVRTEFICYVEE
jgi:hypothetical protein